MPLPVWPKLNYQGGKVSLSYLITIKSVICPSNEWPLKKSSKSEAKRKTFRLRARNVKGKRYDLILLKVFFGGCKAVRKIF